MKKDQASNAANLLAHIAKGQIISKRLLVFSDSSKKRTNEFVFFLPNSTKSEFVRSFLEESKDTKKSF